jgi:hypothetical protein
MIASQSVVPVAGVWPWRAFMTTLMAGAASADVGEGIARQLGTFLDKPAHRHPFADVPYSLIDLTVAETIVAPLKALADALDEARSVPARSAACSAALEAARVGYPDDAANPGDPALLDVVTLCDKLRVLDQGDVAGAATALGDAVRDRLVRWRHSQKGTYQGTSLYYQPVTPRDIERSFILSSSEEDAARDATYYEQLALCQATGWHRIALKPLGRQAAKTA